MLFDVLIGFDRRFKQDIFFQTDEGVAVERRRILAECKMSRRCAGRAEGQARLAVTYDG